MKVNLSQILSSLESGGRPKGGASLDNEGIPSLGAEHLDGNGGFNFKSVKYIPENYFIGLKYGIIEKENILIVKDGATTGKVSFVNEDFPFEKASVNEHVFLLKIDKTKAYPGFAFHYLKCPQGQRDIMRDFRGATVGGISRGFIEFVKFELPSLPSQLYIANILSKAESLISQRKESLRLLDEYLKCTFLEMFGDGSTNKVKLGNVLEIQSGQVNPNEQPFSEMYHVGGANIESNSGKLINLKFAKDEHLISGKYFFTKDHILYSKIRPNLNKVSIPDFSGICSADIYPLLPDVTKLNKHYLRFILMSANFLNYALKHSDRTNIPKINRNALVGYSISLPKIELQTQFAQIVEKTESLKAQYRQSLQELENLYGSLSQRAFRGELG